ncbi:hypothetical protein A2U01_0101881, partial [Trifolium medium]|nr:hypothetical protein [Trifolium medium]
MGEGKRVKQGGATEEEGMRERLSVTEIGKARIRVAA